MSDIPDLKFDVASTDSVAAATQVAEKAVENINIEETAQKINAELKDIPKLHDHDLTDEEKASVEAFVSKIDIRDADNILLYGSDAQKKVAEFSDAALENIKTKDSGEVGDLLVNLIAKLKGFNADTEPPKGIKRLFFNANKQINALKDRYQTVESNVEEIANSLEDHQVVLLKDIAMFDELYKTNSKYFKELTMYIIAGEKKLEQIRNTELKALKEEAEKSSDALAAQKANDLANLADRFEKKLHDLKLTRQVSMQMAPQIRLLQNNDSLLVERIQSTLSNTLPLWKSQMVLALGLHRSQQALKAQTEVTNMTNELLTSNAEKLKMGTIQTAKEAERGIIDIETLVKTNQSLIDTISEVMKIQEEGHNKRVAAEHEMIKIEEELKKKLLEIRN
ncbi:MAG: toxic anion resistance protein [Christensenellaceae bacterium]|nr:toxic anion resistance protein [Christensenellaceae bacterium]